MLMNVSVPPYPMSPMMLVEQLRALMEALPMSTFDDAVGYHWGMGAGWLHETSGTLCSTRVV